MQGLGRLISRLEVRSLVSVHQFKIQMRDDVMTNDMALDVPKGLEGVKVDLSAISLVDGQADVSRV